MSTLRECAEYHEMQAKLLDVTRMTLAKLAMPTDHMEVAITFTTENSIRHVMSKS